MSTSGKRLLVVCGYSAWSLGNIFSVSFISLSAWRDHLSVIILCCGFVRYFLSFSSSRYQSRSIQILAEGFLLELWLLRRRSHISHLLQCTSDRQQSALQWGFRRSVQNFRPRVTKYCTEKREWENSNGVKLEVECTIQLKQSQCMIIRNASGL